MNKLLCVSLGIIMSMMVLQACNSGEEERLRLEAIEQARQDSLAVAREAELEAVRQDSLEQARLAALVMEEETAEPEQPSVEFDPDGRFTVQVQSWRSREKAMNRAELLRSVGFDEAYVTEVGDSVAGDIWYRVKVGNVTTLNMAMRVQDLLRNEYNMDSWIDMADE